MEDRGSKTREGWLRAYGFFLGAIFILFFSLFASETARAQVPDTTQVAPDSLVVEMPARPPGPPVGFRRAEPGVAVIDTMLAQSFERDATGVLAARPASFVYDLGALGWPNGWSPYGLNPQRVALLLDGLPFDDLVTGRPMTC